MRAAEGPIRRTPLLTPPLGAFWRTFNGSPPRMTNSNPGHDARRDGASAARERDRDQRETAGTNITARSAGRGAVGTVSLDDRS